MKQIKKVAVSKIQPADGAVVDSFSASVDKTTNAPSIRAIEELLENYTPSGGASILETNPIGAILEWPSNTIPINWLLCNGQAVSRTEYSELFKVIGTTYGAGDGSTTFNVPDRRGNIAIGKNDSDSDFNTLGKKGGAKKRTLVLANIPSHTHTFTGTAHTHTLNGHTHSVGAHSHGLNSHTHSIPALSGTAKSAGSHSHSVRSLANAANTGGNNYLREWSKSGDTAANGVESAGAHTHSVTTTASTSGKASGSTANSSAFNTGANSGNTSSTTASGTIGAAGSGTEFDIMNPHIVQNFIIKAKETAAIVAKVEDSLTSNSTTDALSAAQGKKLKELIDNLPNSEIQGTGAPEIAIGPDEPTGEEVLWIDEDEGVEDFTEEIITGVECKTNKLSDGKRVFVKRINTGTLPNSSNKAVPSGLDLSMIWIDKLEGTAKAANNTTIPLPFSTTIIEQCVALSIQSNGNINIQAGIDRSAYKYSYVDIYYTKNKNKTINFTVDGSTYQAEEGMTWKEFIDSRYNCLPFMFMDIGWGYLVVTDGTTMNKVAYANNQYNYVKENTVILNGDVYAYNIEPT